MAEFRRIGKSIINVERLLMAGYAHDQDLERNRATLSFDNGQHIYLTLSAGRSLEDLICPKSQYEVYPTVPGNSVSEVSTMNGTMAATASVET